MRDVTVVILVHCQCVSVCGQPLRNRVKDCYHQSTTQMSACQECSCWSCDKCVSSARIRVGFLFGYVQATCSEYNHPARVCVWSGGQAWNAHHVDKVTFMDSNQSVMLAEMLLPKGRDDAIIGNALYPNDTCLRLIFGIQAHLHSNSGLRALMRDPWDNLLNVSCLTRHPLKAYRV